MNSRSIAQSFLVAVALSWSASPSVAADVLVVDGSGGTGFDYLTIQQAVDAASSGDIIVVRTGIYGAVTVDGKSVTIVEDAGADVELNDTLSIVGISAGQAVSVRGLRVTGSSGESGLLLQGNLGPVYLEDCRFESKASFYAQAGALVDECSSVTLVRCQMFGTSDYYLGGVDGSGLLAVDSQVHLYECFSLGAIGVTTTVFIDSGGDGANVQGGFFFAAGCVLSGGGGADGFCGPFGGMSGSDGGDGLNLHDGAVATIFDNTLDGGPGGRGDSFCGARAGRSGDPLVVTSGATVTGLNETLPTLQVGSPVREGELVQVSIEGQPGDLVVLFAGMGFLGAYFEGPSGPLMPRPPLVPVNLGVLPASGTLSLDFLLGDDLAPGVGVELVQQVVHRSASSALLGSPASAVLMDSP